MIQDALKLWINETAKKKAWVFPSTDSDQSIPNYAVNQTYSMSQFSMSQFSKHSHPCKLANTMESVQSGHLFCHCTSTLYNTKSRCSQDPLSAFPEPLDTTKSPSSDWQYKFPGIGWSNGRTCSKQVWYILVQVSKSYVFGHGLWMQSVL